MAPPLNPPPTASAITTASISSVNPTHHHHISSSISTTTTTESANRARQYSHLHAQLAQLNAQFGDLENLIRMTAVQAENMRQMGGYVGGLFVAASKVLGEEAVEKTDSANSTTAARNN
ncbi:MAG: hypothetical protein M1834_009220 [Cirrosporium novae-zelandiae]|nr:MAG: hypothetical protein M1834_009220 [Cirrosporium novae-zelandiae]